MVADQPGPLTQEHNDTPHQPDPEQTVVVFQSPAPPDTAASTGHRAALTVCRSLETQATSRDKIHGNFSRDVVSNIPVALLTGGIDRPYAFGLATSLTSQNVSVDVIGSDAIDGPEMHNTPRLTFLNLRGDRRPDASILKKVARLLIYYARLIAYAATAKVKIFHVLWNNQFKLVDRALLTVFYKLLGGKVVLTVHNVNAGKRDGNDSPYNRLTLKIQYRLADHLFVHTSEMKSELIADFGVAGKSVTVIPFGINNFAPETSLTTTQAKQRLGVLGKKTILFFGSIRQYKGLEYLIKALGLVVANAADYRLVVAGQPLRESKEYFSDIQKLVTESGVQEHIVTHFQFVPDDETEVYFKAADVVVLPYVHVYQSGVLFLGYRFGLPAIASAVGSFAEDIVEGQTGFLCRPQDAVDLARAIETYFASDLYCNLDERRQEIRGRTSDKNSWDTVAEMTSKTYRDMLKESAT